jgi:adenine/guanine phosphoribosyltransferase-like PRPP-binding protein
MRRAIKCVYWLPKSITANMYISITGSFIKIIDTFMVMNMAASMKLRIRAVEYLKMLKKEYTYAELSRMLDLPTTVLNRYIMGRVLPSEERAKEFILEFREKYNLEKEIKKRITCDREGYFDNSAILYDTLLLKEIADQVAGRFPEPEKILTSETDGIPVACSIAVRLGVDAVYARKHREVGVTDYIEETYVPSSSGKLMSLYLPKNAIQKNERVLIVDDVLRSGETQRALINLAEKSGASIYGIFMVISIGKVDLERRDNFYSLVTLK